MDQKHVPTRPPELTDTAHAPRPAEGQLDPPTALYRYLESTLQSPRLRRMLHEAAAEQQQQPVRAS